MRLFLNQDGRLHEATDAAGLSQLLGWWNGIAPADFDGDGDIDYVVTNLGSNSKYHPTKDHPQVVFYGDFEGQGHTHIVEAKTSDTGPVRCSSAISQHSAASTASAGRSTSMFGMARTEARISTG